MLPLPSKPRLVSISLVALSVLLSALPTAAADSSSAPSSNGESSSCNGYGSCFSPGSVIPVTFLVLFLLIMLLWCALHICCHFPCCCCCRHLRMPRCCHSGCLKCCSNTNEQSQVHTHLHAEDIPLTHPVLASPAPHLVPLLRPCPLAPPYRPYKGAYRIGKNHHLQPFTLSLRFDYTTSPRSLSGHGVDDGQSFVVLDGIFTVGCDGAHRCIFVERFGDGSRYVFYGVWDGAGSAEERWSGFWLREAGAAQQGTFHFQWDEAADEQLRAARQAGETDVEERRMRDQLAAARERRYIVLRGLEERKEATEGRAGEEAAGEATAIEMMERRLSRPLTVTVDEVTVEIATAAYDAQ